MSNSPQPTAYFLPVPKRIHFLVFILRDALCALWAHSASVALA